MRYRLIYQKVLTEHATKDDIDIFIEHAKDIASVTEDIGKDIIEINFKGGIKYIYTPIKEDK